MRPLHDEADYDRTITRMNALLDLAGDDEVHPLSGLMELAAELVSRYEQELFWRATRRTGWSSWRMRWKRIGLTDPYCPPLIFTV